MWLKRTLVTTSHLCIKAQAIKTMEHFGAYSKFNFRTNVLEYMNSLKITTCNISNNVIYR